MKNDITSLVDSLNSKISEGKIMEAFDEYYADDVVMQENNTEPRVGKEVNRKNEEAFVNGLIGKPVMKVLSVATGDNVSIVEWFMDINHKDWGKSARNQVAVQHWKDGKIVHERFYYGA